MNGAIEPIRIVRGQRICEGKGRGVRLNRCPTRKVRCSLDHIAETRHARYRELELIIVVSERTQRGGSGVVNRQDCGRARG